MKRSNFDVSKKKRYKKSLKSWGSSYADVCADIEATIDEAMK